MYYGGSLVRAAPVPVPSMSYVVFLVLLILYEGFNTMQILKRIVSDMFSKLCHRSINGPGSNPGQVM